MASVTLMEEELQHSIVTSDDDAEFEEEDEFDGNRHENADSFAANSQLLNGVNALRSQTEEQDEEEEQEARSSESDEDADAEGEEDEVGEDNVATPEDDEDEDADSDEEDGEGVGAVKIHPSYVEDDAEASGQDNEDSDSSVILPSKDSSDGESEVEAAWEAEAEADEDAEETEPGVRNRCIFCQQDEEHDPSEDFEEYLACAVCGDNSHRQCARYADALKSEDSEQWRCPGCVENALEPEIAMADANASLSVRRSSAPKLARDLLPSQRGAIKPDSHSVFNHLIVDDDPMDGSRLLRKRKTSSAEAEDRSLLSLKRQRKTGSDGSSHAILEGDTPAIPEESKGSLQFDGASDNKVEPVAPRPSRSLRLKTSVPRVIITQKGHNKLALRIRTNPVGLKNILDRDPKPVKKRIRSTPGTRSSAAPTYIPQNYSQPFYSFHDKENDELKSKPYGGILTEAEADTSKTLPQTEDRRRFDDARQKAEEEWKLKTAAALAEQETLKKPRKVSGPASQIECINFGGWEIDTWYAAPYPEEYSRNRVLHICEFCLKYMNSEYVAWRHKLKCQAKHPPGDEIYREGSVSIFEVDGRKNPVYCQNLCLLAKLFLGSKTLYYDVEPFLFYVMTEDDDLGCHFVGYFSKEKRPSSQNNVSCILTLPIHQRKGYGNLLIDFSYLLTRVERKSGSPEKPLSDMGLVSYRNYWRLVLCYHLRDQRLPVSIIDISERTGMTADDIVSAMEGLRALVRDPITGTYALRLDYDFYHEYIQRWEDKRYVKLNSKSLVWTPYIMGRNNAALIEHGPPLNTIAPRDGEEEESKPALEPQHPMPNGDLLHEINATASSEEQKQDLQPKPMEVDEVAFDSLSKGGTPGRVKGQGQGKMPPTETSVETPDNSPSTARFIKQSMSTPNGFTAPPTLIIPLTSIPPTRFEIYPPVPGTRGLSRNRHNASASRPSAARSRSALSTTVSQNTNRRRSSTNSARRSTNRHRSGTSRRRRRSGGTGRGPGRWPKGTKKSDFGNAESGPGLPPKILTQPSRLVQEFRLGSEEPDDGNADEEDGEAKGDVSMDDAEDGEEDDEEEEQEQDDDGEEEVEERDGEADDDSDVILYETPRRRRDRDKNTRQVKGQGGEDYQLVTGDIDVDGEVEEEDDGEGEDDEDEDEDE